MGKKRVEFSHLCRMCERRLGEIQPDFGRIKLSDEQNRGKNS